MYEAVFCRATPLIPFLSCGWQQSPFVEDYSEESVKSSLEQRPTMSSETAVTTDYYPQMPHLFLPSDQDRSELSSPQHTFVEKVRTINGY